MKITLKSLTIAALCACLLPVARTAAADDSDTISIVKPADYLIPIAITGFTGETASVLKFDLEVLGMEVVTPSKADYIVTGNNNGASLQGKLTDGHGNQLGKEKVYQGANARSLSHIFAQDVVDIVRPGLKHIFIDETTSRVPRIAFRVEHNGVAEVSVGDWDGNKPTIATHDGSLVNGLSWAPGGQTLFYSSWKNGSTQILEHNLATGERKVFAKHPGANYSPSVSPDGKKVALVLNKTGSNDLYVCNIDGSGLKQLTSTKEEESSPCWSPDSRTICFSCRMGSAGLYKVSAAGGPVTKVTIRGAYGNITEPDWSPDGKWIVFTSSSGGFTLYKVAADGSGEAELLGQGEDGSWAPNSRTIIYTRRVGNEKVLSLLDAPTKHTKNVPLKFSGNISQPDWAQ